MDDYSELFKEFEPDTDIDGDGDEEIQPPELPPEEEPKSEIELVNDFKKKFDYMTIDDLEWVYNKAYYTYLDLAFPLAYEITEIPDDRPRAIYWIKDCMDEIIERNGVTATSYSENGVSWTWSTDMISDVLRRRIVPQAAVRGTRK